MTKGFDLRETAHQSSGLEVLLETYPDFASEFLRGGLQKGVGKLLPDVFSEVPVIKCCNYRLTGTSMSQVVDRFAFDKIQSQLSKLYYFQFIRNPKAPDIIPLPFCAIHYEYLPTIFHQITSVIALTIKALPVPNVVIFSFHNISCISIQIRKDRGRSDKPAFFL